jgi:hypothetical protein
MDHNNVDVNVAQMDKKGESEYNAYVTEADGKQYRVPYKIVKKAVFTNLSKEELIDIPHAARLQYRLMLMDPVIKATVDYVKCKISILYNPREAENIREKISLDELKEFLAKQGVNVSNEYTTLEDYDYYKNLYTYAYTPPSIRERAPYAYSMDEWKKMKPEWEEKMKQGEMEKAAKFKNFQENFLSDNPEMAPKIVDGYRPKPVEAIKTTFFGRLLGKKTDKKEKGFWFHGM